MRRFVIGILPNIGMCLKPVQCIEPKSGRKTLGSLVQSVEPHILIMETSDLPRHQLIKSLNAKHTEGIAEAAIILWEHLAIQIISIVGEDGFNALYVRSIFLNRRTFPWLPTNSLPPQTDHPFVDLKMSFEGRPPAQASEANSLLLITLTDVLASLIGEQLINRILILAWGAEISNATREEFKNE